MEHTIEQTLEAIGNQIMTTNDYLSKIATALEKMAESLDRIDDLGIEVHNVEKDSVTLSR